MATQSPITYYQGDLLQGTFSLRTNDAVVPGKQNAYPIPSGAIIKMLFPGTGESVSLSSATAVPSEFGGGAEITVTNQSDGDCSFVLIPSKGAGVLLSTITRNLPAAAPIDIVVYDSLMSQLQTFEIGSGLICLARSNP